MSVLDLNQAIYIPSRNCVYDMVKPDGRTHYGNETLDEVKAKPGNADAIVLPFDEAHARYEAGFIKPMREIDRERYWEMLEVLPPCKWAGMGDSFESFHVSERIAGNVVSWFVRLGYDTQDATPPARYFTVDEQSTLTRDELRARVNAFIASQGANAHG